MSAIIRSITKNDNASIARVIRKVLIDHGVPKVGTAYADVYLDQMFEHYQKEGSHYFILEEEGEVIGGGGIGSLANYTGNVCELQKMYFLPKARGRGLGTKMIDTCLNEAEKMGYESCYLETMDYMEAARKLYKKYGFEVLNGPLGDTGHYSCGVHMLKKL